MWKYKEQDETGFKNFYDIIYDSAARHKTEAAYELMTVLEKNGYDVGVIAAKLLKNVYRTLPREGADVLQMSKSEKVLLIDELLKSPRYPIRPEAVRFLTNEQKLDLFDKLVQGGAIRLTSPGKT